MKKLVVILFAFISFSCLAQKATNPTSAEQEVLNISKNKWLLMANKSADSLANLFHDKSVFVHMGGSWGKTQELNVIKNGSIWYKHADIENTTVNVMGNTAVLLSKLTLLAVVGGNEVSNPFIVTEVYVFEQNNWKLASLSFTKINAGR
ncbi:nuclear transport factor 2 family protein [Pedobacter aquatilis]|uniref:nuclear transport factor 2 family protein n=1 Tax=Pedobacter aquatilis TaxID=351343 RepID=UPI00292E4E73|nr:nuclear transport factor 2 family protein [Pedobacter aquatilis]